jgi:chromosome segregation ATPase
MEAKSLEDCVALLENEMQALRDLPARVTSLEEQMVQFRAEVRAEFSATREQLRQDIRLEFNGLRGEVDGLRGEFNGLRAECNGLRNDVVTELGAQMRTLHEEALARIGLINRG